jgi:hypothetical protein
MQTILNSNIERAEVFSDVFPIGYFFAGGPELELDQWFFRHGMMDSALRHATVDDNEWAERVNQRGSAIERLNIGGRDLGESEQFQLLFRDGIWGVVHLRDAYTDILSRSPVLMTRWSQNKNRDLKLLGQSMPEDAAATSMALELLKNEDRQDYELNRMRCGNRRNSLLAAAKVAKRDANRMTHKGETEQGLRLMLLSNSLVDAANRYPVPPEWPNDE